MVFRVGERDKRLMRLDKGSNPPETCKAEFYEPPPSGNPAIIGSGGVEVDHNGVVWQNWRVSGQFATFDRSKCDTTSDLTASGQSCPEGWTFYRKDDPTYTDSFYHANESYLAHMDHHDVLGLGEDSAMYGSVNTDAIEVFSSNTGQFVTLRVPYPRSGSSRDLPTVASTIRTPGGRARAYGPATPPTRHGTSKVAKAKVARACSRKP